MNWKLIASIIALLLTGFIVGFFTNRYLTLQKVRSFATLRQAEGIEKRLYRILELEEAQKKTLAPIIKQHFVKLAAFNQETHAKRVTMEETFNAALSPSLTAIQKEKLATFQKRLKRGRGKKHKSRKK